jgi:hypothetical protein
VAATIGQLVPRNQMDSVSPHPKKLKKKKKKILWVEANACGFQIENLK